MIPRPIGEITLDDLTAMVGRVRESKTLEFKRELPPRREGSLKVLAGVTALANSAGGDFVIGVGEEDGVAKSVLGIEVESVDAYARTLDQVLSAYVDPPLPPFDIHPVKCAEGRWAFVIRTPRSWTGPHRVTSDNHFYVRTSTSTVPMDVADLRSAFGLREAGVERIDAFRRERLARITAGQAAVRLSPGPVLVLHMAPLPAFANRDLIDIVSVVAEGAHMPLPLSGRGGYARVNLLGLYNFPGDDGAGTSGYGQLFRSGAYEGTCVASVADGERYFPSEALANMIVGSVRNYLRLQDHYGFGFPTFAMVSFCDAESLHLRMRTEFGSGYYPTPPLGESVVSLPEVLIDRAVIDVPTLMRPLLNIIWNAFSLPNCDMFDGRGTWLGQ